ncbi:MAG: hypothetical protein GF383_08740 [Candidatus Lokiarchaeota archaeon]|nr:hypothetical protein [Candidatus Lokiarchaeota archaeon]MBD3340466.1 hypothetical protein [Candidatus Lokiarchaeota archaeon]
MNLNDISRKNRLTDEINHYFVEYLKQVNYTGLFGVAPFSSVYINLMPIQQNRLKKLLKSNLNNYMELGSIISLAIAYRSETIKNINSNRDGLVKKERWNLYSDKYEHLNNMLKEIGHKIAVKFKGIAIPPTTETPAENINYVSDYYQHTISHRLVAEHAGIGWRGKSELLITKMHGPAVRLTSVILKGPLVYGKMIIDGCGECNACLEACPILKKKYKLKNYREQCRLYIISLGLKHDVCGKCLKACYFNGRWKQVN